MAQVKAFGAVVYRKKRQRYYFLLLKHLQGGHWGPPKGHAEAGERPKQTARREVQEESGLSVRLQKNFRASVSYSPGPGIEKTVTYFLAKSTTKKLQCQPAEISHAVWLELEDAIKLVVHENTARVLFQAHDFLCQR